VPGDMWEEGKSGVRAGVAAIIMSAARTAVWMRIDCALSESDEDKAVKVTCGNCVRKQSTSVNTRWLWERFMMVHVRMEEKKRM